jgi:Right handed beta helix region
MDPHFAGGTRRTKFPGVAARGSLAVLIFVCMVFPAAFATGAGKSNVPCQGTVISPTDDIVNIINSGTENQTFCIEGEHRITSFIQVRSGQSLIGTTPNSRISGAVVLSPWQATSTQGVYYYDGPYAQIQPHQQNQFSGGVNVCYWVTTFQDDLFFRTNANNDQRVMRVLSETEVDPTQLVTTQGQAVTGGEAGRFFFDYAHQRIYVSLPNDQDPNTATVDLAISFNSGDNESLIFGAGANNVTLQNLWVEKGMNFGVFGATSWTIKDMTIRFVHNTGLYNISGTASQSTTVDDTLLTNNGRLALVTTLYVNITNSEMSWNNIANFRETDGQTGSGVCRGYWDAGTFHLYQLIGTQSQPAVTINNLWSHNNIGDGVWSDGGTQYTQITNSTFNGNERYGYLHEISCQITFSGNTIYGNGYPLKNTDLTGGGLNVSDSNYSTFSSNLLYGNDGPSGFAFHLTLQTIHPLMNSNKCLGARNSGDTSHSLRYNTVSNNTIYSCSEQASIGKVWAVGGTLNARHNQYQSNHYHLIDSTSDWFVDADANGHYVPQNLNTWQQGNHDAQGTMTTGCTH